MLAKILGIPDLHKRYSDGSSIKGQLNTQINVQQDIIDCVSELGITHIFQFGDWYDRGFHGLCMAYGAMEMDRRISAAVNGNVYITVGNHFYLERDENPEMYIIQPNDLIRPSYNIPLPRTPIFRMQHDLRIGDVQIDFFHYSKTNKEYYAPIAEGVKYHIGVYHDEMCVPGWVREQEGFRHVQTNQTYFNNIYSNIDLALHGHIHSAIGTCDITLQSGRRVPMFIPGSLGIVQNKPQFKHSAVDCPVITIDDDSTVNIETVSISTHMGKLSFYETKHKEKAVEETTERITKGTVSMLENKVEATSLPSYLLGKGFSNIQLKLVDLAMKEELDFVSAVSAINSEEEM